MNASKVRLWEKYGAQIILRQHAHTKKSLGLILSGQSRHQKVEGTVSYILQSYFLNVVCCHKMVFFWQRQSTVQLTTAPPSGSGGVGGISSMFNRAISIAGSAAPSPSASRPFQGTCVS